MKQSKKHLFAARLGDEEARILSEAVAMTGLNRGDIMRRAIRLMAHDVKMAGRYGYGVLICPGREWSADTDARKDTPEGESTAQ